MSILPAALLPPVLEAVQAHGFVIFDQQFDINIIGCRNPNGEPNKFDDLIYICWRDGENWISHSFQCTTDSGLYWLHNPMRSDGTAILKHPQQMRGAFYLGLHKGKYHCLRQKKPVQVWRDNNKDSIIDYDSDSSSWGIQIHRASSKRRSTQVDKWSAGCTVLADPVEYEFFMECVKLQLKHHPTWDSFSYTLIEWSPNEH